MLDLLSPAALFTLQHVLVFLLVLTRISGLLMSAPNFGSSMIPMQVRAFLAAALAFVITPVYWETPLETPGNLLTLGILLAQEALIGVAIGLAVTILFGSLQLTGQIATQVSGISLAEVADPSLDTSVPSYGQVLQTVAVLVFFGVGGHREMMEALLDSFRWNPPGHGLAADDVLTCLTEIVTQSFVVGIRGAAPVLVALLLAVLVIGLIGRALPQLNLMALGFGLQATLLSGVLAVTLGSIVYVFQDEITPTIESIREAVVARPAP